MDKKQLKLGNPMMVNLPEIDNVLCEDTGEGGMAFFLIIRQRDIGERRQVCVAGDILYPLMDCQIEPPDFCEYNTGWEERTIPIDAGLLIGSTKSSIWNKREEKYFRAEYDDLTNAGKTLYDLLKKIYGEVTIVTLLDT